MLLTLAGILVLRSLRSKGFFGVAKSSVQGGEMWPLPVSLSSKNPYRLSLNPESYAEDDKATHRAPEQAADRDPQPRSGEKTRRPSRQGTDHFLYSALRPLLRDPRCGCLFFLSYFPILVFRPLVVPWYFIFAICFIFLIAAILHTLNPNLIVYFSLHLHYLVYAGVCWIKTPYDKRFQYLSYCVRSVFANDNIKFVLVIPSIKGKDNAEIWLMKNNQTMNNQQLNKSLWSVFSMNNYPQKSVSLWFMPLILYLMNTFTLYEWPQTNLWYACKLLLIICRILHLGIDRTADWKQVKIYVLTRAQKHDNKAYCLRTNRNKDMKWFNCWQLFHSTSCINFITDLNYNMEIEQCNAEHYNSEQYKTEQGSIGNNSLISPSWWFFCCLFSVFVRLLSVFALFLPFWVLSSVFCWCVWAGVLGCVLGSSTFSWVVRDPHWFISLFSALRYFFSGVGLGLASFCCFLSLF